MFSFAESLHRRQTQSVIQELIQACDLLEEEYRKKNQLPEGQDDYLKKLDVVKTVFQALTAEKELIKQLCEPAQWAQLAQFDKPNEASKAFVAIVMNGRSDKELKTGALLTSVGGGAILGLFAGAVVGFVLVALSGSGFYAALHSTLAITALTALLSGVFFGKVVFYDYFESCLTGKPTLKDQAEELTTSLGLKQNGLFAGQEREGSEVPEEGSLHSLSPRRDSISVVG